MKKIVMTGGGTAGHVTPNIAMFDLLKRKNYKIYYIGSKNGMEQELIEKEKIPYHGISSGKMRRYFDVKNFTDAFRVVKGFAQCVGILRRIKPNVVFSKGGFVSVPVVMAAKFLNIPIVLHESDITPGLANKITIPFAKAICASFPETEEHIKNTHVHLTGTPIRKALFEGKADAGLTLCNFESTKPVLLVMGGSQGSVRLNSVLRESLDALLKSYHIVHLCGKNNLDENLKNTAGYAQFEYLNAELPHILALSDIVVSRAGANSIFEFLALKKPHMLIPLPRTQSRGDQILNAESFRKQGFSKVIQEEVLNPSDFLLEVIDLYSHRDKYISAMEASSIQNGVEEVVGIISKYA